MEVVIFHTLELPEWSIISVPPLWKNSSEDDRADLLNAVISALGTNDPTVAETAVAVLSALARTGAPIAARPCSAPCSTVSSRCGRWPSSRASPRRSSSANS